MSIKTIALTALIAVISVAIAKRVPMVKNYL